MTNTGVLLELGQVPLSLYAIKNAIKNWERIAVQRKANELVTKAYDTGVLQNHAWPIGIRTKLSEIGMLESFQGNSEGEMTHMKAFQRLYATYFIKIHLQALTMILAN